MKEDYSVFGYFMYIIKVSFHLQGLIVHVNFKKRTATASHIYLKRTSSSFCISTIVIAYDIPMVISL